jgi:hypothetical protein
MSHAYAYHATASMPPVAVSGTEMMTSTTRMERLPCSTGAPGSFRFREKVCPDCCQQCECRKRFVDVSVATGEVNYISAQGCCCYDCMDVHSEKSSVNNIVSVTTDVPSGACANLRCLCMAFATLLSACLLLPCFICVWIKCVLHHRHALCASRSFASCRHSCGGLARAGLPAARVFTLLVTLTH